MADQKIVEYLQAALAQGKTKEELYKELLGQGQTIEAIQENFNAIGAKEEKEDTQKRTIQIIVTIGAILIGAGIFSYIASNWQEMSRPIKVTIIIVSMLAAYAGGWYLKEKLGYAKTGEALFLLGSIIYGAGIFLVAQMFHTRANWPDGFILWMLGAIAMGFALDSFSHFFLATILAIIALIGHPIEIFTGTWGYRPFLLTSSLHLLAATVVTFAVGWIIRKRLPPEIKNLY